MKVFAEYSKKAIICDLTYSPNIVINSRNSVDSSILRDDLFVLFVSDSPVWERFQRLVRFYRAILQVIRTSLETTTHISHIDGELN